MIMMKHRIITYLSVVLIVLSLTSVVLYENVYPAVSVRDAYGQLRIDIANSSINNTWSRNNLQESVNITAYVNESGHQTSYMNVTVETGAYYDSLRNAFVIGPLLWIEGHFASNLHPSEITIAVNDYGNADNGMIQLIPLGAFPPWMNRTFNASYASIGSQAGGTATSISQVMLKNQYPVISIGTVPKNSFYNFGNSYHADILAFVPISSPFVHVFHIVVTLQGLSKPVSASAFIVFEYGG
ncbi:MAG: hypothetical protein KIY11_09540 [Thermoplasmata archaeon]|nr:hypothetical protein [Candidatus Sysuiplasma acidicola]